MYTFITILIVLISVLLGLIVLIQNPKGGGVSSTFGGASQQIFGAARTTDVVEKTTWTLAIMLLVFTLFSSFFLGKTATATAATQGGTGKAPTTTSTQDLTEPEKRAKEMGASSPANQAQPVQQPQGQQPQPAPAQT